MTTETAPRALYASQRGDIRCADHAPYPGTDTWHYDAWAPLTAAERAAIERDIGRPVGCECCWSIARRRAEAAT